MPRPAEKRHVLSGQLDELWGARYSPDGTHIVTVSSDGSVWLWDSDSGRQNRALAWP